MTPEQVRALEAIAESSPAVTAGTLRELDVARMLREDPPPIPWVAEPLLARGCVTMIAGREGQGKSYFAAALAVGMGYGSTIAGIDCDVGRALYVDAENGPSEAHRRLRHLGAVDAAQLVYVEAEGFHLQRNLDELDALVKRHQPALVVLDSFRSLWPGGDENDSAAVEPVLNRLRLLAERHATAILMLHHAGKVGAEYRGSTAIGGAVQILYSLCRHESDPDARERRELICRKCRLAPEPEPRWIRLAHRDGVLTLDETDAYEAAGGGPRATPARDRVTDDCLDYLAAHGPQTRADLLRGIHRDPKDRTGRRAIETLVAEHHVHRLDDGRFATSAEGVAQGGATPDGTRWQVARPLKGRHPATPQTPELLGGTT